MKVDKGITILECWDFIIEIDDSGPGCCPECHERKPTEAMEVINYRNLVIIRPTLPTGKVDWSLHMRGEVCCRMLDKALRFSHDYWTKKAEVHQTQASYNQHFYGHKDGAAHYREQSKSRAATVQKRKPVVEEDTRRSGGISGWLNRR